jgi:hypothetical protein
MKSCFLFGHADCPDQVLPRLEQAIETAISNGVTGFYVGNRGAFDRLATTAVKKAKKKFPAVRLYLLLAYHPAERPQELSEGFDGTYYPLKKTPPRRFAIVRANEAMLRQADHVICYVNHIENTRKLLELAQKKQGLSIHNIAETSQE